MRRALSLISIAVCFQSHAYYIAPQAELSFAQQWESASPLRIERNVKIIRILVKNKIPRCHDVFLSESLDYDNVYLVACYSGNYDKSGGDSSNYVIIDIDDGKLYRTRRGALKKMPECLPYQTGACRDDYKPRAKK